VSSSGAVKSLAVTAVDRAVHALFAALQRIPSDRAVETLLRMISALVRLVPGVRAKSQFVHHSAQLRGRRFSFTFTSHPIGVRWAAIGFPDLLTRHMLFEGLYQHDVLVALRALVRPGDVVFDVGGHHGLMAVVAAGAAGPRGTIATFEPNPHARRMLNLHLLLNDVRNVQVEELALSSSGGEAPFFVQTGEVSWNSTLIEGFAEQGAGFGEPITVQTRTLDDYIAANGLVPDVIKIDVEGSEFLVVEGARGTIEPHRPVLLMEFNPTSAQAAGRVLRDYVDELARLGYDLRVLRRDALGFYRFENQEPFDEAAHTQDGALVNVLCLPAERR
jgi:FkbM family methyltransferase